MYALQFFLPQLVKAVAPHTTTLTASAVSAVPYAIAAAAIVAWSRRTDRAGARLGHIAVPTLLAAVAALVAAGVQSSAAATLTALAVAICGILTAMPAFWSHCTAHLRRPRTTVTVAALNATANLASFAGPWATGRFKDATGDYLVALLVVGGALLVATGGTTLLPGPRSHRRFTARALSIDES